MTEGDKDEKDTATFTRLEKGHDVNDKQTVVSDVNLSCMYLNARSICNKIDDLLTLVEVYKPHIIAVTES